MMLGANSAAMGSLGGELNHLLQANKEWATKVANQSPNFFHDLSLAQSPEILWIGCSDSRVPPTDLVQLGPGDIFVHRNVANVVVHSDLNLLSVLQYAVDVLKVKHIIVCGHYGCGGVLAAMGNQQIGIIDNWLRNIKDIYVAYRSKIESLSDPKQRAELLVELNVHRSVQAVCHTTIVQNAWARGQQVSVHGWCYRISDGTIRDLKQCVKGLDEVEDVYNLVADEKDSQ
ncbi:carbonic anhydrase [Synchytrium endobioticum]|uniref:Carbonic anhydrase n=1 Tax=Synchytrium endobioticum TaxID=286115 RepID=A0A507CHK0_9FUNG|nr:carbonic anhydrase [Synchytrium endobioticum]TPX53536.1 carbonic anhydrase [Synchytrium endobioticum]